MSWIESFVRNMIKRATITRDIVDKGPFLGGQAAWASEKSGDIEIVEPWGFHSVPPIGSIALMLSVLGHEENRAAFVNDPTKRLRGLKPGEVAVGNWPARSYIKFLNNGDIQITGSNNAVITLTKDMNLTVKGDTNINITGNNNITITGNNVINVSGDTTINSSGDLSATVGGDLSVDVSGDAEITAPVLKVNGAIDVTGDITALFGTANQITFSDLIMKYNAHRHTAQGATAITTIPDNQLP